MKTITLEEFHTGLKAQGVPIEHVAMRCPMCGTIQSAQDLIASGAGKNLDEVEKYLGFSCFGRWTHQKPPPKEKGTQHGCNWTLGGLFQCHDLTVVTPDGKEHPRFDLCTPEEAQAHMHEREPFVSASGSPASFDAGVWFQSACSGLWYRGRNAAGDISAVRVNGQICKRQENAALCNLWAIRRRLQGMVRRLWDFQTTIISRPS